jgi:hypothetical protein
MGMCIKGFAFFYDFSIGIDDCCRSVVFFGVFIVPLFFLIKVTTCTSINNQIVSTVFSYLSRCELHFLAKTWR